VHFALENNGWNRPLECEVHVSAGGAARPSGDAPAGGADPALPPSGGNAPAALQPGVENRSGPV